MSTRVSVGEAFIGGRCVASVELEEQWIQDIARMPLAGQNTYGYKDLSHPGPAYLRVTAVYDDDFRARLERLLEFAAADIARQRAIRDAGQRSVAIDLVVEGSRNILGARVDPPLPGYTRLDALLSQSPCLRRPTGREPKSADG